MTAFVDPEVVVCLGLPRSGSTWIYNVAREVLARRYPEGPIACGFTDDFSVLRSTQSRQVRSFLVKAHNPKGDFRALLASTNARLVISIRDPRDAVASLMRSFHVAFTDAAGAVYSSAKAIAEAVKGRHLLLKYENGFLNDAGTVQRIGEALGCAEQATVVQRIHRQLSRTRVSEKIRQLDRRGAFSSAPAIATWDRETQWHPHHLGDGRVGKYTDLLTDAQIRRLEQHFGFFLSQFSYGCAEG